MTAHVPAVAAPRPPVSVFAGADVCRTAGLELTAGTSRPVFDQDRWVLSGLIDAHRMIRDPELVWDFTAIANPAWRVVAKEIVLAMLAPGHPDVLMMPHAFRVMRSPRTCYRYLQRLTDWFNWLTAAGVGALGQVSEQLCAQYLHDRAWTTPAPGTPRRPLAPETVSEIVRCVQVPALYRDLLSTDRYRDGFTPWDGRPSAQVAGRKTWTQNLTQPVPEALLQPLLATCLFLVDVVGPHLGELVQAVRADAQAARALPVAAAGRLPDLREAIEQMRRRGEPLPALADHQVTRRVRCHGEDPLMRLAWGRLAREVGARDIDTRVKQRLRPFVLAAAADVGFESRGPARRR